MNKWGAFLLLIFVVPFFSFCLSATELKNPFMIPPLKSCEEREQELLSSLSMWQYKGYVHDEINKNRIVIIYSSVDKIWVQLSNLTTPIQFSPWVIMSISAQSIEWQADLPVYCKKQIKMVMNFKGK